MPRTSSVSETVGKIAENGLFKFYERSLIAVGMPAILALIGWLSITVVSLASDMREAQTIQQTVLVPGMHQLTQNALTLASKDVDEDDLEKAEARLQDQIDELRKGQLELRQLILERLTNNFFEQ